MSEVLVLYTGKLFLPGGTVYNWAGDISNELRQSLFLEAPVNRRPNKSRTAWPGTLREGISVGVPKMVGPKALEITAQSDAPYTLYVLRGTGRIFSKTGRIPKGFTGAGQFREIGPGSGMYLPSNPGYGKGKYVQSVSGQTANNFMQRAVDRVAFSHPSLRGMAIF